MDDLNELLLNCLATGEHVFPGRLSAHLADFPGPLHRDPFGWRAVIDAAERDGLIKIKAGEAITVVSFEDAAARADALAHVDNRVPMALEPARPAAPVAPLFEFPAEKGEIASPPPEANVPPEAENPGIRALTESEMFAWDLNATALAEERGSAPGKRKRRTAAEVAADKAAKEAERAEAKARRAAEREALKITRAQERAEAKEQAAALKLEQAEGGTVELPAVVLRDGTVKHVSDQDAWAVMELYLADMCLDCETSGYPLGHKLYELRTIQLGGEEAAVVYDASDPAQTEIAALALHMAGRLRAHSATADVIPVVAAGLIAWDAIWAKMHDSVLSAKLTDPAMSGSDADALKELARDLLGDYAVSPAAEIAKNALFKVMGCLVDTTLTTPPERNGWHRVNRCCVTMTRYAGSDVLDLAAVLRVLPPLPVPGAVMNREREFQASCAPVTHIGFKLDAPYVKERIAVEEAARAQAQADVAVLSGGRIANPKSPDVLKALPEIFPGLTLPVNRKTGQPSADKSSLEKVARTDDETLRFLCRRILDYRHSDTTLGLLLKPFEELCEHGDGRMRPTVYTIEATTGRSCIPESHTLLTQDGTVPVSEIKEGMLTLGKAGQWTRVREVHRYADAPVVSVDNGRGLKLTCTPEHRWVTTLEHRPHDEPEMRTLCQTTASYGGFYSGNFKRLRLHLAPENRIGGLKLGFDFRSTAIPAETFRERFAAIVGMLVTDGTCKDYGPGKGMRAKVYQTERKHYAEFMRVIPAEAVMGDRLTAPQEREIHPGKPLAPLTDHHEIRLKARWLRPLLEDEIGYLPEGRHLRDAESLHHWAATIPLSELRAFFAACWLSDGCVPSDGRKPQTLSCGSGNLRRVLILAAYRLGYVTTEHQPDRPYLTFCRPVLSTRRSAPFEDGRADVWCVTTDDGTFTAMNSNGVMYLTGNSCRRPNAQQLSRQGGIRKCVIADDGYLGVSADFEGCEIRVAAALSGDAGLYEAEVSAFCHYCKEDPCGCGKRHTGLHWRTAHAAKKLAATKEDRYNAKRGSFTRLFGGGAETAADQVGCPVRDMEEMFAAFDANAPVFTAWDKWMRQRYKEGSRVWRDYEKGENFSAPIDGTSRMIYQAYSGRQIYIRNGAHAAGNGAIQGTARELLVDGVLAWRRTRWGGGALLPIHDQVLTWVKAGEAAQASAELARCMETLVLSSPGFEVRIGAEVDVPFAFWPDSS